MNYAIFVTWGKQKPRNVERRVRICKTCGEEFDGPDYDKEDVELGSYKWGGYFRRGPVGKNPRFLKPLVSNLCFKK